MIVTKLFLTTFITIFLSSRINSQYLPEWSSLDTRPLPEWYDEAKYGIFIVWGVYSVPSYVSEWFWDYWKVDKDPKIEYFMAKNYRPNFTYPDFGNQLTNEFFNATVFADIVKKSGAQYIVLTTKHHEGYTLYPSNYSWNWNSKDLGSHQDLVGELSSAIRKAGIHVGLYYSLFEWFNPLFLKDESYTFTVQEYVEAVVTPQLQEVINIYQPEILWSDGDWMAPWQYWNSTQFIAWLYNSSPVKETVVTNDRWGIGTSCQHGDFYTCSDRYNPGVLQPHKWENAMTIDKQSWGFRREARYEDFLSIEDLIATLATTISCGGNLLMNVGPTHDGRITPIFEERLRQMGQFVDTNKEAIFKTKPWIYQNDTITPNIWYVSKMLNSETLPVRRIYNPQIMGNTIVYAYVLTWPVDGLLYLGAPIGNPQTKVSMLGYSENINFKIHPNRGISVDLSIVNWSQLPNTWSWVLKLENLDDDDFQPEYSKLLV